jgi:hypothetical protein
LEYTAKRVLYQFQEIFAEPGHELVLDRDAEFDPAHYCFYKKATNRVLTCVSHIDIFNQHILDPTSPPAGIN